MSENKNSVTEDVKGKKLFISLRWKVLIGFTVIFSIVYFIALNIFTDMAIQAADGQIQADLTQVMEGIAGSLDVDELMALSVEGEVNADGFSDDPRFWGFLEFLDNVHTTEPDAWPYLYIPSDTDPNEIIALVDLWVLYDPSSTFGFKEAYTSRSGFIVKGLSEQTYRAVDHPTVQDMKNYASSIEEARPKTADAITKFATWLTDSGVFATRDFGTYGDQFGRWASGYMPLTNSAGEQVAAVGVDFEANTVNQVREAVRSQVQQIFLIAFPVLLILMVVVTSLFTQPIRTLASAAERIADGDYAVDFSAMLKDKVQDEIDLLAGVFEVMVEKVEKREKTLQRKVQQLQIKIDEGKKSQEVSEITDSEFFQDLQTRVGKIREERASKSEDSKE